MHLYTPEIISLQIVRVLNAAFVWTTNEQMAVATVLPKKPHTFIMEIEGQHFEVTVKKAKP